MALTELKGQETGTQKVVIERGPVRVFAQALGDDDAVYSGEDALVPPTFPFVMSYWGSLGTGGAAGLPIDRLRGPGRAILHGEQAFEYDALAQGRRRPRGHDRHQRRLREGTIQRRQARVLRHRDRLEGRRRPATRS